MEASKQDQKQLPTPAGTATSGMAYAPVVAARAPALSIPSSAASHQHAYQQQQQLQVFWARVVQEILQTTDLKNHSLPFARIRKIIKADEDVKLICSEVPIMLAKACETFILELTLRSWLHAQENKRRTLNNSDIAAAISTTEGFDFLIDTIPRDELMIEEGLGVTEASMPLGSSTEFPQVKQETDG